jgi:hypothetical protein
MGDAKIVDRLYEIVDEYASGSRMGARRHEVLAELAATGADPDQLTEAAARHAAADNWYAGVAVEVLLEAGAARP